MISIPDITMCSSETCSERERCYRAMAKPSEYQSWSNFEYTCNENSGFEDFIPVKHFSDPWNPCKMGVSEVDFGNKMPVLSDGWFWVIFERK